MLKTGGNVIFNSQNETYRTNCIDLKTKFTSNLEEADKKSFNINFLFAYGSKVNSLLHVSWKVELIYLVNGQ